MNFYALFQDDNYYNNNLSSSKLYDWLFYINQERKID